MDKKTQLIQTAFQLFYTQGIHAVGINRVLKESGVAKKTLYQHFDSKEQLIEASIRYRDKIYLDWLKRRLSGAGTGRDAVARLFDALDDWFNNRVPELADFRGCFFINASAEYGDPQSPIHQACARHKESLLGLIQESLKPLGLTEPRRRELAQSLLFLKEGATALAQLQGNTRAALEAKAAALSLLENNAVEG